MKFIKCLLIILGLISVILLLLMMLFALNDKDICLDTGFCKEGLELNTKNGKIHVSEQTCIENDGTWITEKNICSFYHNGN